MEQQEQADILKERGGVLSKEILSDARKKAARILSKAEKEAAAVLKTVVKQSELVLGELEAAASSRAATEANKVAAGSGLECKRLRLAGINGFLETVAEEGLVRLESMSGDEADRIREALLSKAVPKAAPGKAVLLLAPGVASGPVEKYIKGLRSDLELTSKVLDTLFPGEFILEEEAGRVRHVAVFREIFALKKEGCLRAMYAVVAGEAL